MSSGQSKRQLRAELRRKRTELDPVLRQDWDRRLHQQVWQDCEYQRAAKVMLYLSMPEEIQTWPLLHRAWQDGKQVFVPKVKDRVEGMIAVEVFQLDDLSPGTMGIMEPRRSTAASPGELDYIIVPALAFDEHGYRLGYGGGYYDRFLGQTQGVTVGLIYGCFLQSVPKDSWDIPVQRVIMPEGSRRQKRK